MLPQEALLSPGIAGATGKSRLRLPASGKVPARRTLVSCLSDDASIQRCCLLRLSQREAAVKFPRAKWSAHFLG
jgi:hypothetical protein